MTVLWTFMRKLPSSRVGVGCGVVIGFVFGIRLSSAGGGVKRLLRGFMGISMGGGRWNGLYWCNGCWNER